MSRRPAYTCWVRVIYDVMLCVVCWGVVCKLHRHQVRGETGEMLMMVITAVGGDGDTLYSLGRKYLSSWLCVGLSRGYLGLDTNNYTMIVLHYDRLPAAAAPTLCRKTGSYFYKIQHTNQITILLRIGSNLELETWYCSKS